MLNHRRLSRKRAGPARDRRSLGDGPDHGLAGARKSVAGYLALFPDLRFIVDEQISEGDRVVSRWTLTGTHRGRRVRVWGIVISRFEDGKIVEDWAASDTLTLARQLGLWRCLRLAVEHRKLLRNP